MSPAGGGAEVSVTGGGAEVSSGGGGGAEVSTGVAGVGACGDDGVGVIVGGHGVVDGGALTRRVAGDVSVG